MFFLILFVFVRMSIFINFTHVSLFNRKVLRFVKKLFIQNSFQENKLFAVTHRSDRFCLLTT